MSGKKRKEGRRHTDVWRTKRLSNRFTYQFISRQINFLTRVISYLGCGHTNSSAFHYAKASKREMEQFRKLVAKQEEVV